MALEEVAILSRERRDENVPMSRGLNPSVRLRELGLAAK